jgi:flagellar basal-body rod protein FlgF
MNIGLYQSASSLTALERWQDVVTQNITASQVSGYKKRTVGFEAKPLGEMQPDSKGRIGNGAGASAFFPGVRFGVNFQNGESFPTKRPLDVALNSDGFFVVQLPDGRKGYTRAGALSVRMDRSVVAGGGAQILSDGGNPLQMSPNGGEVSINQDGQISQNGVVIGKLGVVRFANLTDLQPLAGGVFTAREGVDPIPVAKPEVMQGQLESSNVSPLREMVSLVNIARAYEANQKVISTQDQTLEKALQTLG